MDRKMDKLTTKQIKNIRKQIDKQVIRYKKKNGQIDRLPNRQREKVTEKERNSEKDRKV